MMKKITKNNIKSFIDHYHFLHDSYIVEINYDKEKSIIELTVDIRFLSEPKLEEDNTYKIKMVFSNIKDYCENNPYDSDYIDSVTLKFFKMHDSDLIWLSINSEDPDEEPLLYIVAKKLEYTEI